MNRKRCLKTEEIETEQQKNPDGVGKQALFPKLEILGQSPEVYQETKRAPLKYGALFIFCEFSLSQKAASSQKRSSTVESKPLPGNG
ncbi:MAG: hypothetical protein VYB34_09625 [Planctomycetota bacterium]|nr:hypothetical protein [Planctomycetota bacterium]MEE3053984.1 hypothetical protein [Planctomycetota bacterium]|tara:strand:+ start:589 stop:849 length:261 start_codon:yes stop_codon:yes gene_type:complete